MVFTANFNAHIFAFEAKLPEYQIMPQERMVLYGIMNLSRYNINEQRVLMTISIFNFFLVHASSVACKLFFILETARDWF